MKYSYFSTLFSICALAATAVTANAQSGTPAVTLDSEQAVFLTLINNFRQQNGVGPLQVSVTLQSSSQWMSADMAAKNYFSHTDSLGRDPFVRMAAFGYPASTQGENIAAGNSDAQSIFNQLLNACDADAYGRCTYGHRENMRNGAYTVIGIGRSYNGSATYRWYWATDFGSIRDQPVSNPPTPTPTPTPTPIPTPTPPPGPSPNCTTTGIPSDHWKGEYFADTTLSGSPMMVRDDGANALSFDWGDQGSPSTACNLPGVSFSARWTRQVSFTAGTYRFTTSSDDGMRLYVDGNLVQDRWFAQAASPQTSDVTLAEGNHVLTVQYYQAWGNASAAVSWQPLSIAPAPAPPPGTTSCVGRVSGDHWKGEYFANTTLSGSPVMVRDDGADVLNFNWGNEGSPSTSCGVPGVLFSARWTRLVSLAAGAYRFTTSSDDGMRLYLDGQKVQDRWYAQAANLQTVDVTLAGGIHTVMVEYYQAWGNASAGVSWRQLSGAPAPPPAATGCVANVGTDHWKGEYFNNMMLSGNPMMVRDDGTDVLNFNWGNAVSPNPVCNIPGLEFSVRWTRIVNFSAGSYRFTTSSDDGMRLYIDGQKVQDRWFYQAASPQGVDVTLTGGTHTLVVEYFQAGGQDSAAVSWQLR